MNRFRFRLETVLRLRGAEETARQRELGAALRRKKDEENRHQAILDAIGEHDRATEVSVQTAVTAAELDAHHRYMQRLEREREAQETMVEKAEEVVTARRGELVEASRKKKTLERLRERALEAHTRETVREEQNTLDDLTSIKYRPEERPEE